MTSIPDELWTPAEVGEYYRVDAKTVTRWAESGKLPVARRTPGGHRRFWKSDVVALGQDSRDGAR